MSWAAPPEQKKKQKESPLSASALLWAYFSPFPSSISIPRVPTCWMNKVVIDTRGIFTRVSLLPVISVGVTRDLNAIAAWHHNGMLSASLGHEFVCGSGKGKGFRGRHIAVPILFYYNLNELFKRNGGGWRGLIERTKKGILCKSHFCYLLTSLIFVNCLRILKWWHHLRAS